MARKKKEAPDSESLADQLFPIEVENDIEVMNLPPEKRRLHTETYDFSVSTVVNYLKNNKIFIPSFQRGYVWSIQQASRLIESLIIQCPIPVIYLSQTPDENLSVIDGNQRINSIANFLGDKFKLKGLTAYPELEGSLFSELDSRIQKHIENRTLRCIVILKETHPQVKFDVFERLNTGSVKLSPQELRHGLYQCSFLEMIEKLAGSSDLKGSLPSSYSERMRTEELILRYFAIAHDFRNYDQPVSNFLNEYLKKAQQFSEKEIKELREEFLTVLNQTLKIFGEYVFKTMFTEDGKKDRFNVAMFDAQMIAVKKLNSKHTTINNKTKEKVYTAMRTLFQKEDFISKVTKATSNKSAVKFRVEAVYKVLSLIE